MSSPSPSQAPSAAGSAEAGAGPGILVDHQLEALLGTAIRSTEPALPLDPRQLQPASMDLRLGTRLENLRAGFLPERSQIAQRVEELSISSGSLAGEGHVLKPGQIYLIELAEEFELPPGVVARFNPRSSSGRCDLFCRVLVPGHPRFDETPAGYHGRVWIEVVPLSFPVHLKRGDRLVQVRLQRGECALSAAELRAVYARTPLCFDGERPIPADEIRFDDTGALELRVGLSGRQPCGWRAALHTPAVQFAGQGVHSAFDFWETVYARDHGGTDAVVLDPGRFYIFASSERLRVPPDLAAEMLPVDVGVGELRNNYAGFFDNGFGWQTDADDVPTGKGTPAVLEVRAHDVPFLVEDGQIFFKLRFFRAADRPRHLYGEGRSGPSYQGQDLTLARPFAPPTDSPRQNLER